MKTAIPLAVAVRKTDPRSESAATIATPAASSSPGTTMRSGHQWPVRPVITIAAAYTPPTYGAQTATAPSQARNQQRRAADRPHHQWLKQPALRVPANDPEGEEDGEHDAEEERREHREAEQERSGEGAWIDPAGGEMFWTSRKT
jgi:hypothetical protein